ncbi:MAG: ABC transporter permease [Desulfobacterales bacterium]|nr:MAG: ABC transporter permease [Desulfobacterales bacterium]
MVKKIFVTNPTLAVGLLIVLVVAVVSLGAVYMTPYNITELHILDRLQPPSKDYFFGTDQYGRDLFSRVLVGGRTSLTLGLGAVLLELLLGIPIGIMTGYFGGKTDEVLMRLMDTLMSIPSLLMALLILTALGGSMLNAMLAIAIVGAPRIARVVRSATLALKNEEFVLAARARGESHRFVMFGEILPNVLSPIIVEATIGVGFAIMIGAGLSYLGLGVQPPNADWGLMIRQAREYLFASPYPMLFPGCALAVTIIGFNLLGDGLRDLIGEQTE